MNALDETYSVITKLYGSSMSLKFVELQKKILGGKELDVSGLPPVEQIKELNAFWRKVLNKHPDTTAIKAWLCEGGDIQAYIYAFEHSWLPLIVNAQIL